ncbi:hypothetical protein CE91St46_01230 [Eubacteriales bacterium]|nr:hypothetical protein [Faecalicatena sp. BF-R-105]GKH49012.1 hypothetical protein CE91St46_01230 [Eubacteriales bacterium]GKH61653.1 hypothetical protein CE91St47_01220 [Eubacteriales bacterium]SFI80624.1 hypothetical protein SAMN02910435_00787 [Ruminococcaceae bacterium D5]
MNRNRPLALLLAAMFLLAGCSREGFEASLSRADKSSAPQAQSSRPEQAGAVYELEELTADGIEGSYQVPAAAGEAQEKAVKRISRSIRGMVKQLPELLAQDGAAPAITLESKVTRNDGTWFSISFSAVAGEDERRFGWGMTFDSATGGAAGLDSFIEPEALSVLLLDGPSAELLEEGDASEAQRAYLTAQGSESLCGRLLKSDYGDPQTVLDASYYLDGSNVVAVFAAPQEDGGVVRAAIKI